MACHRKGTSGAVIAAGKRLIAFGFYKVRQDVVVAPAPVSKAMPFIVITAIAADVDHVIDRVRSADDPALRHKETAPIQMRLGNRSVRPVARAVLQMSIKCRYPDSGCVVLATSFEEQYPARGIFGQSACQDAPGRSCSNDDVVKHQAVHPA